jgi:hypothetical protein
MGEAKRRRALLGAELPAARIDYRTGDAVEAPVRCGDDIAAAAPGGPSRHFCALTRTRECWPDGLPLRLFSAAESCAIVPPCSSQVHAARKTGAAGDAGDHQPAAKSGAIFMAAPAASAVTRANPRITGFPSPQPMPRAWPGRHGSAMSGPPTWRGRPNLQHAVPTDGSSPKPHRARRLIVS